MNANAGYNYNSIMHYGPYSFSKNGKKTMVPLKNGAHISEPYTKHHIVKTDAAQINYIYKCH